MIASAPISLESLVDVELPPLPNVAMRVAALTQDMDASTRDVAEAIGCDPILAARVLRAANSPLYCLQRHVTALPMAVHALGNESIHSLVFVSAAADAFKGAGSRSAVEIALWQHSIAVGAAAREIMLLLRLRGLEEGLLCGLLHDFGKLLLLRYDPEGYQELLKNTDEKDQLTAEKALFGYTHPQVGALAAKRWNLPDAISYSIYHHHDPSQSDQSMLIARVVDLADALANRAGLGLWEESSRDLNDSESVIALNLSPAQLDEAWEKTQLSLTETFALFGQ